MDKIPLPFYEAVPLEDIARGVKGVRVLFVNVFALSPPDSNTWTLVDAGLAFSAGKIKHWAENHFGQGTKPQAVLLTHGHFDHVGAIKDLLEQWNVPVYAHPDEFPYLTGQAKYPPPDPSVGGGLMAVISPLYPRTSADLKGKVQPLPPDGSVPNLPGWRWIHTPGHTAGHVSFFREEDKLLLPGDAFCTTDQNSFLAVTKQRPELHGPPAYYTPDWDAARESVRILADLCPRTIAPGHGLAMCGDEVADQLKKLSINFDHIAIPEHGKYVHKVAATE